MHLNKLISTRLEFIRAWTSTFLISTKKITLVVDDFYVVANNTLIYIKAVAIGRHPTAGVWKPTTRHGGSTATGKNKLTA